MDTGEKERLMQVDQEINNQEIVINGLFAGFSFSGIIQVLSMENALLLNIAAAGLALATILFALRINIAIRIVSSILTCNPEKSPRDCSLYVFLLKMGTWIELFAILFFWCSLIPLAFHMDKIIGIFMTILLPCAFLAYSYIIKTWLKINENLA